MQIMYQTRDQNNTSLILHCSLMIQNSRIFKLQESIVKQRLPGFETTKKQAMSIHIPNTHLLFIWLCLLVDISFEKVTTFLF